MAVPAVQVVLASLPTGIVLASQLALLAPPLTVPTAIQTSAFAPAAVPASCSPPMEHALMFHSCSALHTALTVAPIAMMELGLKPTTMTLALSLVPDAVLATAATALGIPLTVTLQAARLDFSFHWSRAATALTESTTPSVKMHQPLA